MLKIGRFIFSSSDIDTARVRGVIYDSCLCIHWHTQVFACIQVVRLICDRCTSLLFCFDFVGHGLLYTSLVDIEPSVLNKGCDP